MIKAEYSLPPVPEPAPYYPRLMRSKLESVKNDPQRSYIVLFQAPGRGVVVWAAPSAPFQAGAHTLTWRDESFEDFTGVLHLENVK